MFIGNLMAFILDGNSEIGAYVGCNLFNLISLSQSIRSKAVRHIGGLFSEDLFSMFRVAIY